LTNGKTKIEKTEQNFGTDNLKARTKMNQKEKLTNATAKKN